MISLHCSSVIFSSSFFFFLLIFPNEWLWKAVFISAIAWPLLKQAASGNILVAIIIQNVQKLLTYTKTVKGEWQVLFSLQ